MRFFVTQLAFFLSVLAASVVSTGVMAQEVEQAMIKQGLVDVQKVDPTILVKLKYSTTDNFVGKDVYGDLTRAYMQPMAIYTKLLTHVDQYEVLIDPETKVFLEFNPNGYVRRNV